MEEMYFTEIEPMQIVGNLEFAPTSEGPWEVVREIRALCPFHFEKKAESIIHREQSDGYYLRVVKTGENDVVSP